MSTLHRVAGAATRGRRFAGPRPPLRADTLRHEGERERAPDARRALHREVAAHEPRVGEADGEAEARPAGPGTGLQLLERLEHPLEVLRRDADPRVRDDDLDEDRLIRDACSRTP